MKKNRHTTKTNYMPLYLWPIILLVTTIIIPVTVFKFEALELQTFKKYYDYQFEKYDNKTPVAVFYGNSLTLAGIEQNSNILGSKYFSTFYHLFNGGTPNFKAHLEQILKRNPELLVIQIELLGRIEKDFLKRRQFRVRRAYKGLQNGLKQNRTVRTPVCNTNPLPEDEISNIVKLRHKFFKNSLPIDNEVYTYLNNISDRGIQIILLDIPRSKEFETKAGHGLTDWRAGIRQFSKETNIPVLSYQNKLSKSEFCDYRHMTPELRKKYSFWVGKQITRLLNESR